MGNAWFNLPGPKLFADRIDQDLRQGVSVILSVPQGAHEDIVEGVRSNAEEHGEQWDDIVPSGRQPIDTLFEQFVPDYAPGDVRNVERLVVQPSFQGRTVFVDGRHRDSVGEWCNLLKDFAHAMRSVDSLDRSQFVFLMQGPRRESIPATDVLLREHRWDGLVDTTDALILAHLLLRSRGWKPLRKDLAASVCAEISQWDLGLCCEMASLPLKQLLEPRELLRAYSNRFQWDTGRQYSTDEAWRLGAAQTVHGVSVYHSAFFFKAGAEEVIKNRLWSAHLKVAYPVIERRRQDILSRYGALIDLPHVDRDGRQVTSLEDMEIGSIAYQFVRNRETVDHRLRRIVRALSRARNQLAHMEPLDTATIIDGALESITI